MRRFVHRKSRILHQGGLSRGLHDLRPPLPAIQSAKSISLYYLWRMSGGIIGALIGGLLVALSLIYLTHPKTRGQRITLFGLAISIATVPPTVGSLLDTEHQRQADIISNQQANAREQSARDEMRREFQGTRAEMTASVRQILLAIHDLPPGPGRTRAIQSALLNFDRAASRLGPESRTGVAALLPLAIEASSAQPSAARESRTTQQGNRADEAPDTSAPAAAASSAAATTPPPVVVTPVFIPPPVVLPPPIMPVPVP